MNNPKITVWTPEREAALRARYVAEGAGLLAAEFGVTEFAVRTKARKLQIIRHRTALWQEAEDNLLRTHYHDHTLQQVAELLPGRTVQAISSRVQQLGLRKSIQWTPEQDADLRRLYAAGNGAAALEAFFGRSFAAITRRASALGIRRPLGPKVWSPERREYLRLHYAATSNTDLAKHFGLSITSVCKQASKMGLSKSPAAALAAQLLTKRVKAKAKARVVATPAPDYRAEKRKPCGLERKAGTAKAKPAAAAKMWYHYPHNSAEYKAGQAAYFAGKQARAITDSYGRPATVYTNSPNAIGRR